MILTLTFICLAYALNSSQLLLMATLLLDEKHLVTEAANICKWGPNTRIKQSHHSMTALTETLPPR